MRTQTGAVNRYVANNPPDDQDALANFLREELARIQAALNAVADGQLDETTVAPPKPRDGMLRFTKATAWNPGSGAGFYGYNAGAWHFLG